MHEPIESADEILGQGAADGVFTHAVATVAVGGETIAESAFGGANLGSVFDLASLTKPLSTAVLTLRLVEDGLLDVEQPIGSLLGAGDSTTLAGLTIHHLLTHTSGLPAIPAWPGGLSRTEMIDRALTGGPKAPPGAVYTYSDTGYILLGEIVSRVLADPLDRIFDGRVSGKLGLTHLRYLPPPAWRPLLVPTSPGAEPGIAHDPRARDLGGVAGHAGLFGAAADVLACAEAIRTGERLLSRKSTALMAESRLPESVGGMSYGFFCAGNPYRPAGDLFSDRAYGHSGFTGTLVLIDPAVDATVVLLTNRVWNEPEGNSRFLALRRKWLNAVAEAVTPPELRRDASE